MKLLPSEIHGHSGRPDRPMQPLEEVGEMSKEVIEPTGKVENGACGFSLFGMLPLCVLPPDHSGDHHDGFGGYTTNNCGFQIK